MGLNDLEADVYMLLLQEEALTGYKVAKQLGKPTANVYKAIDSLAKKGALLLEDKQSSQCKAVPIAEFCDTVEAGIRRKTKEAREVFNLSKNETYDEKSYQLQSVDLVLEKSRQMLQNCQAMAMVDAFPKLAEALLPDVLEAIGRGIEVYLQVYQPLVAPGAKLVLIDRYVDVLEYWRSEQLNLIVDGKEYMLALLSNNLEEVYQATWSRNLYLSGMLHMGFSNHYTVARIRQVATGPGYPQEVADILEQQSILSSGKVPGVKEMLSRFGLK